MTHDLLRNVIDGLNARVTRVVVGALREDTFHATIWMDQQGEVVAHGCAAVGCDCAGAAGGLPDLCEPPGARPSAREFRRRKSTVPPDDMRRWLENLNDDEMGRYKM